MSATMTSFPWSTALVTGASSGIGEAMARQLAAGGTQVVLVARSTDRLERLAAQLATPAEVLTADLADDDGVARVEQRLADPARPVDLVVNNAGFGAEGDFAELPAERVRSMLAVNVDAVTRLTHAALPGMLERGRGAVCNVSSMVSLQPGPGLALYTGTKAFVTLFTESLHEELRGTGVTASVVLPGFTRTEFQQRAGFDGDRTGLPDLVWESADDVARQALAGTARGRATVVTGTHNRVVAALSAPVPRGVKRRAMAFASRRFPR